MELRQLTYFVAIAQSGTITAAAQKLHMSQPPLSLQLQKLEEELGCPLFERDTRHLHMTQAGELFYERAQGILQQCADLKREMADLQAGGRGLLRIGSLPSLSTSLLPHWVARFHTRYPHVRCGASALFRGAMRSDRPNGSEGSAADSLPPPEAGVAALFR